MLIGQYSLPVMLIYIINSYTLLTPAIHPGDSNLLIFFLFITVPNGMSKMMPV